jgi:type I restriction enzyme, S subunit
MMDKEKNNLPELPKGWVWTRVGELYNIVGGGTPSTKIANYWNGNIPWITSADIYGLKNIIPRKQITEKAIDNSATHLVPVGSLIVVTRVGLGKIALTKEPLCFSQDSQALIGNSFFIFPDYSLYHLSTAVQIFKYKHRGTTIAGVTKKQLSELEFALPPLSEQHRIVAKIEELFTRLDAGVAALMRVKAELKHYCQAVLKYAFEGKLTAAWREANKEEIEPASVLLERIKEERKKAAKGKLKDLPRINRADLPEVPEGWLWVSSRMLFLYVTSGSRDWKKYYSNTGALFIRTQDINKNKLVLDNVAYVNLPDKVEGKRSLLKRNDILIIITGANVGKVALVDRELSEAYVSQSVALARLAIPEIAKFIHMALIADGFGKTQLERMAYGMGRPVLSLENVEDILLPLPPINEQQKIIEEIESRLSVADAVEYVIEQNLKQSERLRQSILKKAFEGKLVPQDPSDEPAEKLLERIKAEKANREAKVKGKKASKKKPSAKQGRLI